MLDFQLKSIFKSIKIESVIRKFFQLEINKQSFKHVKKTSYQYHVFRKV